MKIMKTVMMTISRGSLIRNFFHSGVVDKLLDKGMRVVVLTPHCDDPVFRKYRHKNLFFERLFESKHTHFKKLFIELLKGAVFNKTVHVRYKHRITGRKPVKILYVMRMIFLAPLGYMPGFKKFIRWIHYRVNPEREHDRLFEKYQPDLVVNTAAGGDVGVIKSAKRYNVMSVDMPKSWDNVSKCLYPAHADYLIVWGQFMKEEAVKFQDYKEGEIIMSGGPQFDYYSRKENLLTREEFCQKFNFDPNMKIILYGSTGGNCCDEVAYIDLLYKYIQHRLLSNVQVLIRPHPGYLGDADRFKGAEHHPGFIIDRTDKSDHKYKDRWDVSEKHQHNLFNSLHHADVVVNIASTLTLDAIVCNTPVININFDIEPNTSPHWSTKRLYGSDYIVAMANAGGSRIAESPEMFLESLKGILECGNGTEKRAERETMIRYFLFRNDGKSAERIVDALTNIMLTPLK